MESLERGLWKIMPGGEGSTPGGKGLEVAA